MQLCVSSSSGSGSEVAAITSLKNSLFVRTSLFLICVCLAMSTFALKVLHSYYASKGFTLTERQHPQNSSAVKAMFADLDKIHWSVITELQQNAQDSSLAKTFAKTTYTKEQAKITQAVQDDPGEISLRL